MKSFVIHLERSTSRRAQVDHIQSLAPDAEILPACDGSTLDEATRNEIYPQRAIFEPRYPFPLSNGEIGCFESHKAAWRQIVDGRLEGALIIEDDVEIDPDMFQSALSLARANIDNWGYTQFQVREVRGGSNTVANDANVSLVRPDLVPLRTSAQLVSHAAAEKLLGLSEQIDRPVDVFLQMRWVTDVEVTCVVPSGVTDRTAETGGSTLSRKRSIWDELKASIPRLRYRRAIKRLSAKY